MTRYVITGTGTGIGKTIFAAGLAGALGAHYWKPVQAGLEDETDSETVARLSGLPPERILPEAYRLTLPASPHLAAESEGVKIDTDALMDLGFGLVQDAHLSLLPFRGEGRERGPSTRENFLLHTPWAPKA